jgi:hypothetical protein
MTSVNRVDPILRLREAVTRMDTRTPSTTRLTDAERIDRMPLAAFGTLIDRPAATADRGVDKLDT